MTSPSSTAPAAAAPMYRYAMGSSSRSMTVSSTSEKNTAPTCRTAAAVTPPEAASAAAIAGSTALDSWLSSTMVSRPRPMRALRSPAAMAVIHRAPAAAP